MLTSLISMLHYHIIPNNISFCFDLHKIVDMIVFIEQKCATLISPNAEHRVGVQNTEKNVSKISERIIPRGKPKKSQIATVS